MDYDFDGITINSSISEVRAALTVINISKAVQDIFEGRYIFILLYDITR